MSPNMKGLHEISMKKSLLIPIILPGPTTNFLQVFVSICLQILVSIISMCIWPLS